MRVLRLPGVFQSRDEARDVVTRISCPPSSTRRRTTASSCSAPPASGPTCFFTREPVRSLEDVRRLKLWRWDVDDVGIAASREMGLEIVPLHARRGAPRLRRRAHRRLHRRAVGGARLPWSSVASYVTDLHSGYVYGCLVFGERQFQRLAPDQQAALRAGAARVLVGIDELGRRQDEAAPRRPLRQAGAAQRAGVGGLPRRVLRRGEGARDAHRRPADSARAARARAAHARRLPHRASAALSARARRADATRSRRPSNR